MTDYVLITPVKNEENNFQETADSILNQTMLPKLWVIIDGGSIDKTVEIAERFSKEYSWIVILHQQLFSDNGGHTNVSLAVEEAYIFAVNTLKEQNTPFDYIGTLDADQTVLPSFFEYLMKKCDNNPAIGAASGRVFDIKDKDLIPNIYPSDELPNKRLYRHIAIDQIGGFPISKYSHDTIVLAKLRLQGWKIQSFPEQKIINLREDSGIERNMWNSHIQFGKARYYLGYSFLLLLLSCGYLILHGKIVKSVGVFYGYLGSWIARDTRIEDISIRNYFHYTRLKEVMHL